MKHLALFQGIISEAVNIVIISHRNPDGDAIGSSLALSRWLISQGKHASVILPSAYPSFFNWMPGVDQIKIYDDEGQQCRELIDESDLVMVLDFNSLKRVDKMAPLIESKSKEQIVMIDHHLYPEDFAGCQFSDTNASSTAELLYLILKELNDDLIDLSVAECLFLAMTTDTGGFKYNTTARTFKVASELIEKGVDNFRLQDRVFNQQTPKQMEILAHSILNRLEIKEDLCTGIIALSLDDFRKFDIDRGDTEGIVNQILKIRNIKLAIFIREQPTGIVKLSLRSRGSLSVHDLAQKYFDGGGHKNAAGGHSYKPLPIVLKICERMLNENKLSILNAEHYE